MSKIVKGNRNTRRTFLQGATATGIVMYGRPRCCKGKTELNRR